MKAQTHSFTKVVMGIFVFAVLVVGTVVALQQFVLAQSTPVYTPPSNSPLALRQHPRLLFTQTDVPGIKSRIQQYYAADFAALVGVVNSNMSASGKGVPDLYFDARNLSFLCALDPAGMGIGGAQSRSSYCQAAVAHALAIDSNCSESVHDYATWWTTGGCKITPALVYDWSYNYISASDRQALVNKMMDHYNNEDKKDEVWPPYNNNHHLISNQAIVSMHAVTFPALAIWGDDAYVNSSVYQSMLNHFNDAFLERITYMSDYLYGPDGDQRNRSELYGSGNPEGSGYASSINPAYMFQAAAASTALGIDLFEDSAFTKNILLYYFYKQKPFSTENYYYSAVHDTCTPHDGDYEINCDTNDCDSTRPQIMRFWAYQLKDSDPTLASLASWMVSESAYRVPIENYKYADGIRQYGLFGMFLGGERDVPAQDPDALGIPLLYRNGDWTVMKSDHDTESATYLEIDAPIWNYVGGHNKDAPAALQLSKYGTLIVRSGNTKGGSSCPRISGSSDPAFSSMTGPYTGPTMDTATPSNLKVADQAYQSLIAEGSKSDIGDIVVFDKGNENYSAFGYDYTRTYAEHSGTSLVQQYMVYLRGVENHEFFVEMNHINSSELGTKLLHLTGPVAAVGSNQFRMQNAGYGGSHGALYITNVSGASATIFDAAEWVLADGSTVSSGHDAACRDAGGQTTLRFQTAQPQMVTVYQPGDAHTMTSPATVATVTATGMSGVQVDGRVVLFPKSPTQSLSATGYTVNASGMADHVLLGFAPQTQYAVTINGTTSQIISSVDGVLYFTSPSGQVSVSVGGGQQPNNIPPVAQVNGPYSTTVGIPVQLLSTGSRDADGSIVSYQWNFGDGTASTQASPSHVYTTAGTYTITLTVTDDDGATNAQSTTVTVTNTSVQGPQISLIKSVDKTTAQAGDQLAYSLIIRNAAGAGIAQNVVLRDVVPPGTEFVSASNNGIINGDTVTWPSVSLAPGQQVQRELVVRISDIRLQLVPDLSITTPTNGQIISVQPITVSGQTSDVDGVVVSLRLQSQSGFNQVITNPPDHWTVTGVPLQSGQNTLTVTATDSDGLTAQRTVNLLYQPVLGGGVILQDTFENPAASSVASFINDTASSITTEEAYSGTYSLKMCADQTDACKFSHRLQLPGGGYDALYARYIFKIGNVAAWYDSNGNPYSGEHYKNPGLEGGTEDCKGGYNGDECVTVRSRLLTPYYGVTAEGYVTQDSDHSSVNENVNVVDGQWHCWEEYVRLNTPGQADGEIRYWVDGQQTAHTGLVFSPTRDWKLTKWWWTYWSNDNWYGPTYIDDLVISTEPIGCPF